MLLALLSPLLSSRRRRQVRAPRPPRTMEFAAAAARNLSLFEWARDKLAPGEALIYKICSLAAGANAVLNIFRGAVLLLGACYLLLARCWRRVSYGGRLSARAWLGWTAGAR